MNSHHRNLGHVVVVISTLLLVAAANPQLGGRDNPLIGSVSGHVYTNDVFKLSYTFPAEWNLQDRPSAVSPHAIALLDAQTGPVQNPLASVALSAEKIGASDSLDPAGYLDGLERPLKESLWEKAEPGSVPRLHAFMWSRRDFTSRGYPSEFTKLAVLVTPSHGYMLRLFCWGKTPVEVDSAVNTMDGLVMKPDWNASSDNADVVPPAPGKRVRVSSGVTAGNRTRIVDPEYPKEAHDAGVHGGVYLRVLIGDDGSVKRLYVLEGDPLLAQAAINAVQQWRYKPYRLNGQPVEVVSVLSLNFR